mmetsp:Transcript_7336/g.13911  ORF Transcript_7336/g.13911 Transcript_7336/m.13911 type:complete len:590 (+) Transcript_7336:318-2087(+)
MLFYESHNVNMFSSLDPNCTSAMGGQNLTPQNESSPVTARKQAFASEGDEIFLPHTSSSDEQQHFHRPFESNPFLSAPSAPQENPFSKSISIATTGNSQTSTITSSLLQSMAQGGDSKQSSHGSSDGSSHLSVRPFGNDTRHSSPCLSVESASVLTHQSSQPNGNLHTNQYHHHRQQQQQSFVTSQNLPMIPDFRKEHSLSPRHHESTHKNILQGQNMNSIKLRFATHVSEAVFVKSQSGHLDIRMKLVMFINSTRNGTVESKATHVVQKWYTDLCKFHELAGLLQLGFTFPVFNFTSQQKEGPIAANDFQILQKYFVTVTESFLNIDHKNRVAQKILTFLEDEANSLSDKIRMLLLEARLVSTMNCCDQLQSRLQITEKNLSDSLNLVAFLRFRVEQLDTTGNSSQATDNMKQQQVINGYHGQPAAPSKNSVDPGGLQTIRLDSSVHSNNLVDLHSDSANPSQLVTLAESVLNEKGPLPVGEVGKMLQEATGNPNLSQILKERYNGLKKFLEKYSDKFIMSCDHPFNPHVYLRRSYSPDDQRLIESGSTVFLDKKVKRTRRKEKKTWPTTGGAPSPTVGSFHTTRNYI